ncbi:MAG TPA: hypothetical protein VGF14_05240 [Alphaproteobacteria bacterium]
MLIKHTHTPFRPLALLVMTLLAICVVSPAFAQIPTTFDRVNERILQQVAVVPNLYKRITVLMGVITVMAGLHGFFKGLTDGRNPAPQWKKLYLVVLGGILMYIGSLAISAEQTVFGKSGTTDLNWTNTTKGIDVFK